VDFVRPPRGVVLTLVSGRGHYDTVIRAVREARCSVWIATANLKELMVEDVRWSSHRKRRGATPYRSVIGIFEELAAAGVAIRILHASPPSQPFRAELVRHPALSAAKSRADASPFQMRTCPRVHLKLVAVDGRFLYLGSANWTGAGLGAKGTGRRNFELGFVTDDEILLDETQEMFDRIWRGAQCAQCTLRCPSPLDRAKKRDSGTPVPRGRIAAP
jgi:phosphatidylserine/phosphatidylglycerophosphate/cardiolipin synthase-like enzyme